MDALGSLHAGLVTIAERSASISHLCANEESAKLYLILPVLGALGYDYADPFEVQPEYLADIRGNSGDRVDYAILRQGTPIIAVECKRPGLKLEDYRGQLRSYFAALPTVRLGILTDGFLFEFFTDCEMPNVMDECPFLVLNMHLAASGDVPAKTLKALYELSKVRFEPASVAEMAEISVVSDRLKIVISQELRQPSEEFCRFMLQRAGLKYLRKSSIQSRFSALIKSAIEESILHPVVELLRSSARSPEPSDERLQDAIGKIVTTERELALYSYVCRRLSFLVKDEKFFAAIERVAYRDYSGKFVIYLENVRKGRVLEYIEGEDGMDRFMFPDPWGEIVTDQVSKIDQALQEVFIQRVRELMPRAPAEPLLLRGP